MVQPANGWTPERIARLEYLWTRGLSASEIARELGGPAVTRSSVLGKALRLGLSKPPRKKPEARSVPATRAAPSPVVPQSRQGATDRRIGRECGWVYGDPRQPGWGYCGKPTTDGAQWCDEHRARVYVPRVPKDT